MQCEMCGETIRGAPKLIRVEGAELQVCARCGKFGTEVQQPRRTDVPRPAARPGMAGRPVAVPVPGQRKRDMFDYMEGEIVDDYAARIKNARMEKGLTQKDLALQMMVRELLIKKIEKGELIPEEEVRKETRKSARDQSSWTPLPAMQRARHRQRSPRRWAISRSSGKRRNKEKRIF